MSTDKINDDTHHLVRDAAFLTEAQKLENFVLTPPMVLSSALLYLMLAEGEIGAASQTGSTFVTPLLQSTRAYVHAVPLDRFLQDAPPLLSVKERLSVLVNVRDAMVSDGHIHEAEQEVFDKLTVAFGIKPQALETFLEAITAKNNKASLGDFDGTKLDIKTPSPHVGLAAAIIKAVTSPDGSVAADDMDRLEGLVGEYDGLLEFTLEQTPKTSAEQLFEALAETLNRDQKLFVLTNVFEAMHREGDVEAPEKTPTFEGMRSALGFTESAFKPIVLALKAKSAKSAATRDQTGAPIRQSVRSKFARKPKGFAQANAVDEGIASSKVVQVGGRPGITMNGAASADLETRGMSIVFDATTISNRATQLTSKLNISRQEIRSNSARRANFAKPSASARVRTENRASVVQGAATAAAQARLKLETTRMQMESTRAANVKIRARMDQSLDFRNTPKMLGGVSAKEARPQTVAFQATNASALTLNLTSASASNLVSISNSTLGLASTSTLNLTTTSTVASTLNLASAPAPASISNSAPPSTSTSNSAPPLAPRSASNLASASALTLGRQARGGLEKAASLLTLVRKRSPRSKAHVEALSAPIRTTNNALESGTQAALSRAFDTVKGKFTAGLQNARKNEMVLQGANLSDPDLLWRFALPVLLVVYWLVVPAHGSLLGSLPLPQTVKTPCWLNGSVIKPLQVPSTLAGCWSSPRMYAGLQLDDTDTEPSSRKRARPPFVKSK